MAKKSKLRKRLPLVGIFLLLIIGICFFMYPIVSNWISEYSAHAVIRHYDDRVQKMGDNAIQKIASQAEEYNKALANNDTEKISVFTYNEMLSVTDAIGYIDIPKIGVYTPVYHGLGDSELQKGIGHMEGTSLPIGGESTHCVLAGHTGLPGSKLFTDIDTLREGDAFYIHVLDRVLKYRVDQIKVVLPNDSDDIQIIKGEDHVTMVTCTPYGINDHRLLVRGTRVAYKLPAAEESKADAGQTSESGNSDQPSEPSQEIRIKNEKEVSDIPEIGQYSYSPEDDTKQVIPTRTLIWYIATGIIGVVLVGITMILVFPSKKKKRKKNVSNQVPKDENDKTDSKSADLED